MMGLDSTRVEAVVRKELQDYRRKRSIVVTMAVLPFVFLIEPIVQIFLVPASTSSSVLSKNLTLPLLYLLLIPIIIPATLAAYSIAGEREQGTLEPLLTRTLAVVDPNLTITSIRTMQQQIELSFDQERAVASLAGLFGIVALLLAAGSVYAQHGGGGGGGRGGGSSLKAGWHLLRAFAGSNLLGSSDSSG